MNSKNDVGWYTKIPDSKLSREFILDSSLSRWFLDLPKQDTNTCYQLNP